MNDILERMNEIGLCRDASLLYFYILQRGRVFKEEIPVVIRDSIENSKSKIEMLVARHLIVEDFDSYHAIDPEKAFKAIINDFFWAETNEIRENLKLGGGEPENKTLRMQEICRELQEIASAYYTNKPLIEIGQIKIANNPDQMASFLSESIDLAQEEICCVSTSPLLPQLSIIWESILRRINKKVRYIRITDIGEIFEHGLRIVQRDVEKLGIDLQIIEREKIDLKFYLIDKQYAVIFHRDLFLSDSIQSYYTHSGQVISSSFIINPYKENFESLFAQSIPAKFVIRLLLADRLRLLNEASNTLEP